MLLARRVSVYPLPMHVPLTMRPSRLVSIALVCFTVASIAACERSGGVDGMSFPLEDAGPYAVGFRELEVTYNPPDGGPPRTIPIAMWYPADVEKTAALPTPERPIYYYIESEVAVLNAPPAAPAYEGGYPVVVHSHGHWAYQSHSYQIGEGLAALGVVFIAPGHVGDRIYDLNTMVDDVDDMYERVYDIRATLDLLEHLPTGDPFAGKCNTTRVVMTAHSRGTNTVWATLGATIDTSYVAARCANGDFDASTGCPAEKLAVYEEPMRDSRVVGGIPMAGNGDPLYFGGYAGMNSVTVPVLMMSASNNVVGDADLLATVSGPEVRWAEFAGGCHDLFGAGICGPGEIDNAIAQPAIRTYIYAFARHHILGDDRPLTRAILDGTASVASIVTFHNP